MAVQSTTQLHLKSIVKRVCLLENGSYNCDNLDPLIEEAEKEFDQAVLSSTSALGHSATADVEAAQAKLNRYLEAQALCESMAAVQEADGSAEEIAAAMPEAAAMSHHLNFSRRRIE